MGIKRKPLTEEELGRIGELTDWSLEEVPQEYWDKIPLQRRQDTVAVLASGCYNEPRILNGIEAIAGFDHLVHEPNPMPGEPEGNAYHYVVQVTGHPDKPYVIIGPFRSETHVNHWHEAADYNAYWASELDD